MRISDQVDIAERARREFPPQEFIFSVVACQRLLMTAEKQQSRFYGEDMQQQATVLFSEDTGMVMPVTRDCQLLLGKNNSVRAHTRRNEVQLLPAGKHSNRELRLLAENKYLVSSFNEPHTILEYQPDRQDFRVAVGIGEGHARFVYDALLLDSLLATCSTDCTVKFADIVSGDLFRQLEYPHRIHSLVRLSGNTCLIGPASDSCVEIYDVRCKRITSQFSTNEDSTLSGLLLPNGKVLLGHHEHLSVLDIRNGKCEKLAALRFPHKVWNIKWFSERKLLISGGCFASLCELTNQ